MAHVVIIVIVTGNPAVPSVNFIAKGNPSGQGIKNITLGPSTNGGAKKSIGPNLIFVLLSFKFLVS